MIVERNDAIAIVTLCDWLENLTPVFQPMRSKTKTYRLVHLVAAIFPRFELQVTATNSNWFITLLVPVLIGRSNYVSFDIGFSTVI